MPHRCGVRGRQNRVVPRVSASDGRSIFAKWTNLFLIILIQQLKKKLFILVIYSINLYRFFKYIENRDVAKRIEGWKSCVLALRVTFFSFECFVLLKFIYFLKGCPTHKEKVRLRTGNSHVFRFNNPEQPRKEKRFPRLWFHSVCCKDEF